MRRPVSQVTFLFCSIPTMSSAVGAHAQWRHESARDRRERRQRAECRLRLRLVRARCRSWIVKFLMPRSVFW